MLFETVELSLREEGVCQIFINAYHQCPLQILKSWIINQVRCGGRGSVNMHVSILKTISWVIATLSLSSHPTMVDNSCLKSHLTDSCIKPRACSTSNSARGNPTSSSTAELIFFFFHKICQAPSHSAIISDPPNLIPIWQKRAWGSEEGSDLPKVTQPRRDLSSISFPKPFSTVLSTSLIQIKRIIQWYYLALLSLLNNVSYYVIDTGIHILYLVSSSFPKQLFHVGITAPLYS